jgi:hypothetical protein
MMLRAACLRVRSGRGACHEWDTIEGRKERLLFGHRVGALDALGFLAQELAIEFAYGQVSYEEALDRLGRKWAELVSLAGACERNPPRTPP